MKTLRAILAAVDRWQRSNRIAGPAWAVNKKFSDDQANLLVVALGWYGFTAIYPLLLVIVTILGFIGQASLGHSTLATLHKFPVVGDDFTPGQGGKQLHGSVFGLVIGVAGLTYGAQGVTQTAQLAMARVWNVPKVERPGFLPRLSRSLIGLALIGGAFLITAVFGTYATGHNRALYIRVPVIVALLVANAALYFATFRALTPKPVPTRPLVPGAIFGAVGFTALTTVGTGLVTHELTNKSATYGAFASVIGVVAFLLLLAKLSIYGAELNPVLHRKLWPRALPTTPHTEADDRVLRDGVHEEQRRKDQRIGVGFHENAVEEARTDVVRQDEELKQS